MKLLIKGNQTQTVPLVVEPRHTIDLEFLNDDGSSANDLNIISTNSNLSFRLPEQMNRTLAFDIITAMLNWGGTHTGTKEDFGRWLAGQAVPTPSPLPILKKGDEGIDVSKWQGEIDWAQVAGAGKKFAFIKASEGKNTDSKFFSNWQGAKKAGILRGAYCFFSSGVSPDAQADYFSNLIKGDAGELPPVLDVETDSANMVNSAYTAALLNCLQAIERATGKKPIIYTSAGAWEKYTDLPKWASEYPLWVAHYTTRAAPIIPPGWWSNYYIWQYSNQGAVPGIKGNVDLNRVGGP